jgi:hypothetical protein
MRGQITNNPGPIDNMHSHTTPSTPRRAGPADAPACDL